MLTRPIAFLATTDPVRALAFFKTTLGLQFVSEDSFALIFDMGGTELRVQVVDDYVPQDFTVLGWEVADIGAAVTTLAARGVEFEFYPGMDQDELGIWDEPDGASVAWFRDPDGNVLSLTQR
jgi:catechol 2,3-dioxygenase-like lactoylglutathione lyase family enzyme